MMVIENIHSAQIPTLSPPYPALWLVGQYSDRCITVSESLTQGNFDEFLALVSLLQRFFEVYLFTKPQSVNTVT